MLKTVRLNLNAESWGSSPTGLGVSDELRMLREQVKQLEEELDQERKLRKKLQEERRDVDTIEHLLLKQREALLKNSGFVANTPMNKPASLAPLPTEDENHQQRTSSVEALIARRRRQLELNNSR